MRVSLATSGSMRTLLVRAIPSHCSQQVPTMLEPSAPVAKLTGFNELKSTPSATAPLDPEVSAIPTAFASDLKEMRNWIQCIPGCTCKRLHPRPNRRCP